MVLLSDPVQLLLTAQALVAMPFSIRAWIKAHRKSPASASGSVFDLAKGDPADMLGPATQELVIPGGLRARGHRIIYSRHNADGSDEVVLIQ
jgi:hypothetical protein